MDTHTHTQAREYFKVAAHGTPGVSDPNGAAAQCPNYDVKANIHLLSTISVHPCRDTSLTRNKPLLGPYSRTMPRAIW